MNMFLYTYFAIMVFTNGLCLCSCFLHSFLVQDTWLISNLAAVNEIVVAKSSGFRHKLYPAFVALFGSGSWVLLFLSLLYFTHSHLFL